MFDYLIEKIQQSPFTETPFRHLYIKDFFSPEHFAAIVHDQQINLPPQHSVEQLIDLLQQKDYSPEHFPGCTTNIEHYLRWFHGDRTARFEGDLLEGFGIAFRLRRYDSMFLQELVDFLNSSRFHAVIKDKFQKQGHTRVETAIQKYLSGYEISQHPDIRKKCLTYMININTSTEAEQMHLHTHLLRFDPAHQHVYKFWQDNPNKDRCWVPWSWCETQWEHSRNNSILMFAPTNDSLHAVKLDYDHLALQRTQIYGNLWYGKGSRQEVERWDWRRLPSA